MSNGEDNKLDISEAIQTRAVLQSRAASEKLTPEQIRDLQDCVAEFKDNYLVIRPKDITKPGAISIERLESYNALREKLTSKEAEDKELKCEGKIYCYGGLGGSYENNNTGLFSNSKLTGGIEALANWDVSEVTSMWALFRKSNFNEDLTPLANWDTSNVTNMGAMFENSQLTGDLIPLANWDTLQVTNMGYMFNRSKFTGDLKPLSTWDTSQVTNMGSMFQGSHFTGDLTPIANWDTSKVTNMQVMFCDSRFIGSLAPLSKWNTSKVTDMSHMFRDSNFTGDLTPLKNWKIPNLKHTYFMFSGSQLTGDFRALKNWDLTKFSNHEINNMFENVGDSKTLLIWNNIDFTKIHSNYTGSNFKGLLGFKGVAVANGWTNVDDSVIDGLHDFNNPTMFLVTDNTKFIEKQKSNNYNYSIPIELMYNGQTYKVYVPAIYDSKGSNDAMSVIKPVIDAKIKEKIEEIKKTHSELKGDYAPTRSMTAEEKAVDTPLYLIQTYKLDPIVRIYADSRTEEVPFDTVIEYDETVEMGKSQIKQKGKNGIRTYEVEVTTVDGIVTNRRDKSSRITVEPTDQILLVGCKGTKGADGTSAYDIWKAEQKAKNPEVTEADLTKEKFLESLKGQDGLSSKVTTSTNKKTGVTTITIKQEVRGKDGTVKSETSTITIENGKSITGAKVDNDGNLQITIEGQEKPFDAGKVRGENGKTPQIEVGEKINGVTKITIKGYNEKGEALKDKVIEIKDGITYVPVGERDEQNGVTVIRFYPAKPGTTVADTTEKPIGNEIKIYDGLSPLVKAGRNETDDGLTLTITTLTRNDEGKVVKTPKEFNIKDGKNGITPKIMARREKDKNGRTGIAIYACYPKKKEQLLPETRATLLSSDDEFYDTPPTLDDMLPPMAMTARSVMPDSETEWHQSSAKSDSQVNQDRDKKSLFDGQINTRHEQSERDRKGNSTRSVDDKPSTSVSLIAQPKTESKANEADSISLARRDKEVAEYSNPLKKQRGTQTTDSIALVKESKKDIADSASLTKESKKADADTQSLSKESKKVNADTHSLTKENKKAVADTHYLTKENKKDIADSNSLTKESQKVTRADSPLVKKVSQAKDSSVDKMYQLWKENPENAEKSMDEFVTEIEKGQRPAENIQVAKLATDSPLGRTSKHLPSTGSAFGFASFAGMSLLLVGAGMAKKKAENEQ